MSHEFDPHHGRTAGRPTIVAVVFFLCSAPACNLFSPVDTSDTSTLPSMDVGEENRDDMGTAADIGNTVKRLDIGSDISSDTGFDDQDVACSPESDDEFCARNGAECGVFSAEDNCGTTRSARCGTCPEGSVCGLNEPAKCGCEPETTIEFCERLTKDCGEVTGTDNCGATRTEECGECPSGESCGESTANVCGCPCDIDGACYPDGAVNPDNACEVCDSATDTTAWTIREGDSCDDGNACTDNDTCTADGVCDGTQIDCSMYDSECQQGLCDATSGCYPAPLPEGTGCTDDGDPCTRDVCSGGTCTHDTAAGVCVIDSTCYSDSDTDPTNPCRICDASVATDAWTDAPDGTTCPEVDTYTCTTSSCSAGQCVADVDDGLCLISGACYSADEVNPNNECQSCQPTVSQTAWSNLADGTTCANGTCSAGVCGGSTDACNPPGPDECYIDGQCYTTGEFNPDNACQACDPATSQTSWSISGETTCNPGVSCASSGSCYYGFCYADIDDGYCYADGTCYADGERNPDNTCQYCDTSYSQYTLATDPGTCFIDGSCRADGDVNPESTCEVCDSAQSGSYWSIRSGYCRISGACYTTGDESPDNPCMECDPSDSQYSWSEAPNSKVCSGTCTCHQGECKVTGGCSP